MSKIVKLRRGLKSELPTLALAEIGFTTDEEKIYIGGLAGNVLFPSDNEINQISFDVKKSGGDNTGVTPVTSIVQSILDDIETNGGGTIKFPAGTYLMGEVDVPSNVKIVGDGATIKFEADCEFGFEISNEKNIVVDGLIFDGQLQQSPTGDRYFVYGNLSENVVVKNCELKNGFFGVFLSNVTNGVVDNNIGYGFERWPFYVEGCLGFKYLNNVCHDNDYDGLKMAGVNLPQSSNLSKDIIVAGNICYNNTRDGFDMAGNNILNAEVYNNIFYENTLQGIDFKTAYQGQYVKNIKIHDNLLIDNGQTDINARYEYGETVENFVISENLSKRDGVNGEAIIVYGFTNDCYVSDNKIIGSAIGVRCIDSTNVIIENNNVVDATFGVQVEKQVLANPSDNIVRHNVFDTVNSCVYVSGSDVQNTIVHDNYFKIQTNNYKFADLGTGTIKYQNVGGYASASPTAKSVVGEIFYNTTPTPGGYMGWVCTSQGDPATFKGFGLIEA